MLIPSSCFATCRLGSRLAGPCSEFHQEQGQWREGSWHLPWFHRSLALCIASQSVPLRGKDSPSAQLGHQLREAQDGLLDLSSSSGVELLPIFEFDESQVPWTHPQTGEHLCQYWGYQTCGLVGLFGRVERPFRGSYNTPMQRFALESTSKPWAAIVWASGCLMSLRL